MTHLTRTLLFAITIAVLNQAAFCQDFPNPKVEIFGGYSFARQGDTNIAKGWNGAVAGNFNKWFGIASDVSGHYYSEDVLVVQGLSSVSVAADAKLHSFLAGPRFTARQGRLASFGHVLFGGAHTRVTGSATTGTSTISVSDSSTGFSFAAGGGVDIGISDSMAIRAIQADFRQFRFDFSGTKDTSNGVRLSAGIVFRIN
jgi:hypothetical protein